MTNIDTAELARRFEALGHAVRQHNESASPGEVCGDPEQFWNTAELLRLYPEQPLSQLIAKTLLGFSPTVDNDAALVEQTLVEAHAELKQSERGVSLTVSEWSRADVPPVPQGEMLWIAYNPEVFDHLKNREQFNGTRPDWGDTEEEFRSKQGIPVPNIGDQLNLRAGKVRVYDRRLEAPEIDENGRAITTWYWTVFVR